MLGIKYYAQCSFLIIEPAKFLIWKREKLKSKLIHTEKFGFVDSYMNKKIEYSHPSINAGIVAAAKSVEVIK